MEINTVIKLGKVLHPRTGTAPERFCWSTKGLKITGSHRFKIGGHSRFRIYRGYNLIDKGPLIKISISNITAKPEQSASKQQHIIGITGLIIEIIPCSIQNPRLTEMF